VNSLDRNQCFPPSTFWDLVQGIWHHLSQRRRRQLLLSTFLMLLNGVVEVLSLATAVPFLSFLTDPQRLLSQPLVSKLAGIFGLSSPQQLLLPFTLAFGLVALMAASVRLLNLWVTSRLAASIGTELSCEAYKRTLYQPYSVHLERNSSEVITAIGTHTGQTISAINSFLGVITASLISLSIIGTLLFIDWFVACTAITVFALAYCLLSFTVRRRLSINGLYIISAQHAQIKSLQEGLGAIRDVLLDGNQNVLLEIYQRSDRQMRSRIAQNNFLSIFPRYTLEALGLLLIAFFGLFLSIQRGASVSVLPLLGTLALGSQRLLPAMQQIYAGWASMRSIGPGVDQFLRMINQPLPRYSCIQIGLPPLQLQHSIKMQSLSFRYSMQSPLILHAIDLEIFRGEKIGIFGSTGSGKSTLVDLLMGLLEPTEGQLLIDGLNIHDVSHSERLYAWRSAIAHVPQTIYLADCSIAENIAFGVPLDKIDQSLVRKAAHQAKIDEFIETTSGGYNTFVGERGIRLSGGQRQRLGIARALYKQAKILIFDEATSALDNDTEASVIDSINQLDSNLTVLMIAHRLNTISRCDRVIGLTSGRVVADGSPADVLVNGKY